MDASREARASGVVGSMCECFGCQGFAYDFDRTTSCDKAKRASHEGGPSPNSLCPWPADAWTSPCGYHPAECSCWIIGCGGSCGGKGAGDHSATGAGLGSSANRAGGMGVIA